MRTYGLALALALALGWGNGLRAQQPTVPAVLTLAEAQALAAEFDPDVRRAAYAVEAAEVARRASYGAFLPDLSLNYGLGGSWSRSRAALGNFGETLESDTVIESRGSSTNQGLSLSMTLFDGGRSFHAVGAARADLAAQEAGARSQLAAALGEVARQYWRVVADEQAAALERRLLALANEQLDATERLLGVGARDPLDVLGAQAEQAQREQALARAIGDVRKSKLALLQAMGVGGATDFDVASDTLPLFDPAVLEREALVALALRTNPELVRLAHASEAAEDRTDMARSARWPQLSLSAGFARDFRDDSFGLLWEPNPFNRGFQFSLGATLPVFRGFETSAAIAQSEASYRAAVEQQRAQRLSVERDVRGTVIDLENQYAAVVLAIRASELARERMLMAQERYQLGAMDFVQFQQYVQLASQAETALLNARLAFVTALVRLEELVAGDVAPRLP